MVSVREKNFFLDLKLTENQYKFVILCLIKSNQELSFKCANNNETASRGSRPGISGGNGETVSKISNKTEVAESEFNKMDSPLSEQVISETECWEIIDEENLNNIISHMANQEKNKH